MEKGNVPVQGKITVFTALTNVGRGMIWLFEKYTEHNAARCYRLRAMTTQQHPSQQSIMFYRSKIITGDFYEPVVCYVQQRYSCEIMIDCLIDIHRSRSWSRFIFEESELEP